MRIWLCLYGTNTIFVRAVDETGARAQLTPKLDGFPPDVLRDVTDVMESEIGNFIQQARDRVGAGAESSFRYSVGTLHALWRGESAPDEWQERYAKEWQRAQGLERDLSAARSELTVLKEQSAAAALTTGSV